MKMKLNNEIILIGILALTGTFLISEWIEEKYPCNRIYVELHPSGSQTKNNYEIPVENVVFQPRPTPPKEFEEQIPIPMEVPENKEVNLPTVPYIQPPPPPPLYEPFFEKTKKDLRVQEIIDGREYNVTGMRIVEEKGDGRLNN